MWLNAIFVDLKYYQFLSDIRILGHSLEKLRDVVEQYERQNTSAEWFRRAQRQDSSERLWARLTGDFLQTLEECHSLLDRHNYLRNGRSKFSSNIRWWLTAEGAVDNLMARLKFHIDAVQWYTKPSEFQAAVQNAIEVQDLRRRMENLQRLIVNGPEKSRNLRYLVLSEELRQNFETALRDTGPKWVENESDWPLQEAFDSLAFHFAAGTVRFNPTLETGRIPDRIQYLELAKSIWVSDKIKQSPHFQGVGLESLWTDRMRQFEDDVRGQLHRFEAGELEKPEEQSLLEIGPEFFSVSDRSQDDTNPLDAGQPGPHEEKILEIELPSDAAHRQSTLLVFRENDTDYRLVTSTKQGDTLVTQYDKEIEINIERHRLVPAYNNPFSGQTPRYNLLLYNEKGRKAKEFVCRSKGDIQKLQRALTGYRVHHDMSITRWCINGSDRPGDFGKGVVQLWQYKPLATTIETASATSNRASSIGYSSPPIAELPSPAIPSTNSFYSRGEGIDVGKSNEFIGYDGFPNTPVAGVQTHPGSRAVSFAQGNRRWTSLSGSTKGDSFPAAFAWQAVSKSGHPSSKSPTGSNHLRRLSSAVSTTTSVSQKSMTSPVRGPRGDAIQLSKAEPPVLLIMTMFKKRFSFVHLTCESILGKQRMNTLANSR